MTHLQSEMEEVTTLICEHGTDELYFDSVLVALTELFEQRARDMGAVEDTWGSKFEQVVSRLCEPEHVSLLGHVGWELIALLSRHNIKQWRKYAAALCDHSPSPRELVLALTRSLALHNAVADQAATMPLLEAVFARLPNSSFKSSAVCQVVCALDQPDTQHAHAHESAPLPDMTAWLACLTRFVSAAALDPAPASASVVWDGRRASVSILGHPHLLATRHADPAVRTACAAAVAALLSFHARLHGSLADFLVRVYCPSEAEKGLGEAARVSVADVAVGRCLAHAMLSPDTHGIWPSVIEYVRFRFFSLL